MSEALGPLIRDGLSASGGIIAGSAILFVPRRPEPPHRIVAPDAVADEEARFVEGREWARTRTLELRRIAEKRFGPAEGRIFDPQLLMLDDPEIVGPTLQYIRDLRLSAERAFFWRILELRSVWERSGSPMLLDRLSDLDDFAGRILHRLLDTGEPDLEDPEGLPGIVVTRNLTPSVVAGMDPARVQGIAAEEGTRTSHWAILARSLGVPCVVGLGEFLREVGEGDPLILDGRIGRLLIRPDEGERRRYGNPIGAVTSREEDPSPDDSLPERTLDGHLFTLRANLDLPEEAPRAALRGARGIGLLRTEFFVIGRRQLPEEEEQYRAFRQVVSTFPDTPIVIRIFDLGGDKFPSFLPLREEKNPFLGWRSIRVLLDEPDLFRGQLRAVLRAAVLGDVRLLLPLVNTAEEVHRVRTLLAELSAELTHEGVLHRADLPVGILVETPAAALHAEVLASHADFLAVGTNDLVQYTLAVDRTNARLAPLYDPFHPAVLRQIRGVMESARRRGIEMSVCGELAGNPLGALLLLGMGVEILSVAWTAIPGIRRVLGAVTLEEAAAAATEALEARTSEEALRVLEARVGSRVDVRLFGMPRGGIAGGGEGVRTPAR